MTAVLDTALAWLRSGCSVVPVRADGSKRPALDGWKEYQQRRPTAPEVTEWFTEHPEWGLGIVSGTISGNLLMVEFEAVAVREEMQRDLREEFSAAGFPDLWQRLQTYVEYSAGGGLHWFYRIDERDIQVMPGNEKLARRRVDKSDENPSGVVVLAETRGEGGQTVVAPSGGSVHANGQSWHVLYGTPGAVPTLTWDEHQTVMRLFSARDEMADEATQIPFTTPSSTFQAADGSVSPGDDFAAKVDWADILVPAGWRLVYAKTDGTRYWRRPGKKVGISATTGYGTKGHDLLYVFTTNTEFDALNSYSKLAAYAVLNGFGRDYSAAARALQRLGYGQRPPERPAAPLAPAPPTPSPPAEAFSAPGAVVGGATAVEDRPTWAPVDLDMHLDGTFVPEVPTLMRRADGIHLLYAGRVHSFHGESESGKSWCGLHAAAEELRTGGRACMVDFESDAHTVIGRLLRMGVPREAIRERFTYIRPEANPEALAREALAFAELLGQRFGVVVIDGVTEALGIFAVPSKDNDEVTKWIRGTPRRIAQRTGAAVVLIDHVTKDSESRGRFAIGGQAKMAALDGAAYVVEVLEPLGVGLVGRLSMRVAKDRPGGVRPHAGAYRKGDRTQEAALVVVDSSQPDRTSMTVDVARDDVADAPEKKRGAFQPTGYMQRVSKQLEIVGAGRSRNQLVDDVGGNRKHTLSAIVALIEGGYAAADGPTVGGYPTIRLIKPFREDG